jgi:hypothetical protein
MQRRDCDESLANMTTTEITLLSKVEITLEVRILISKLHTMIIKVYSEQRR